MFTPEVWYDPLYSTVYTYGGVVELHSAREEGHHQVLGQHPNKAKQAHVHSKLHSGGKFKINKCRLFNIAEMKYHRA